jgi:carbon monoxide dehydrogenase subunit G
VIEHDFRTTVARSREEAFDFLVDFRNEPQWEPNCKEVEKTSDGPIGRGTTFRAKMKGMGQVESEIVEFERPVRFATRDTARGMNASSEFAFEPSNGGTQVSGKLRMEPRGLMRVLEPLMRPRINRMLGKLPDNLRRGIEARG